MSDSGAMDLAGHTMDHSGHSVDHSAHANHTGLGAAQAVLNATVSAAASAASEAANAVRQHMTGESGHDHAAMGHDHAAMGHDHAAIGHDHAAMGHDHAAMDHSQHMGAASGQVAHIVAGHSAGGHGMSMTFHFGVNEYVLFDGWHVTTVGGMVASCLGLFLLALLYEGLKYKREDLLRKNATRNQFETLRVPTDEGVTEVTTVSNSRPAEPSDQPGSEGSSEVSAEREPITAAGRRRRDRQRMLSTHHFLQTFLHALQVVVGYFLMLAFMTYNVWLGIAIVLGAAAGYFIFGSKKFVVVDVTEHCH